MSDASYVTSLYTFCVPLTSGALLYNANTGAAVRLDGPDAATLAQILSGRKRGVALDDVPASTRALLRAGGFLINDTTDELAEIRHRFRRARDETPLVVTITTTLDCNLGCYYCYEERSGDKLLEADIASIVAMTARRLEQDGHRSLHVDWYGGEPLLNLVFLEACSKALQELCEARNVPYSASIISNGTEWPRDVSAFVTTNKIRQAQISFDGLKKNHDKRRRYRKEYEPTVATSSFNRAVDLVDQLLDCVRVDVRFNIDRDNKADLLPFIRFARSRGWFDRAYPAVIQPARLASYSEKSSFMRRIELSVEEYESLRALVRTEVGEGIGVEESEAPDGYPFPRQSVCAALATNSVVVGADRREYRCGLQVSERNRSVGLLTLPPTHSLPVLELGESVGSDAGWWKEFDPTALPSCSRCSFLPICWGGCPKKHLEDDRTALAEQGVYWRTNLARLVTASLDLDPAPYNHAFTESDQFRT